MSSGATLKPGGNEESVSWVLTRLRPDNTRAAVTLAYSRHFPSYDIRVAAELLGIIQISTKRDALLLQSYRSFIAPTFPRFPHQEDDLQASP